MLDCMQSNRMMTMLSIHKMMSAWFRLSNSSESIHYSLASIARHKQTYKKCEKKILKNVKKRPRDAMRGKWKKRWKRKQNKSDCDRENQWKTMWKTDYIKKWIQKRTAEIPQRYVSIVFVGSTPFHPIRSSSSSLSHSASFRVYLFISMEILWRKIIYVVAYHSKCHLNVRLNPLPSRSAAKPLKLKWNFMQRKIYK